MLLLLIPTKLIAPENISTNKDIPLATKLCFDETGTWPYGIPVQKNIFYKLLFDQTCMQHRLQDSNKEPVMQGVTEGRLQNWWFKTFGMQLSWR